MFEGDVQVKIDTVNTVLSNEDIRSESSATTEEFLGTSEGV